MHLGALCKIFWDLEVVVKSWGEELGKAKGQVLHLIWGSSKTSGGPGGWVLQAWTGRRAEEVDRVGTGRAEARVVVADVTSSLPPRHNGSFIQAATIV